MLLFRIFFIKNTPTPTQSEAQFFQDVFGAADRAWQKTRGNSEAYELWEMTAGNFELEFKKRVPTKSIAVLYRANENEQYKVALLKGIGNVAAWEKAFVDVFNLVPIEQSGDDGADKDQNGNGNGDGAGSGNGSGLGVRPCIPILDDAFNALGLGKVKKYVYGAGAVYFGLNAFESERPAKQFINGSLAAVLGYAALFNGEECQSKKKLKA